MLPSWVVIIMAFLSCVQLRPLIASAYCVRLIATIGCVDIAQTVADQIDRQHQHRQR